MNRTLTAVTLYSCESPTPEPFEPLSSAWMAPNNRWPAATPPAELRATGFKRGEIPPDFRLPDQFGDEVSLWQFHGRLIIIDISAMWCAPCRDLAEGVEQIVLDYADTDLVYMTMLVQDASGNPPVAEDASAWSDVFGIVNAPLISDVEGWHLDMGLSSYPTVVGVGRELRVFEPGLVSVNLDEDIRALIEANL